MNGSHQKLTEEIAQSVIEEVLSAWDTLKISCEISAEQTLVKVNSYIDTARKSEPPPFGLGDKFEALQKLSTSENDSWKRAELKILSSGKYELDYYYDGPYSWET